MHLFPFFSSSCRCNSPNFHELFAQMIYLKENDGGTIRNYGVLFLVQCNNKKISSENPSKCSHLRAIEKWVRAATNRNIVRSQFIEDTIDVTENQLQFKSKENKLCCVNGIDIWLAFIFFLCQQICPLENIKIHLKLNASCDCYLLVSAPNV